MVEKWKNLTEKLLETNIIIHHESTRPNFPVSWLLFSFQKSLAAETIRTMKSILDSEKNVYSKIEHRVKLLWQNRKNRKGGPLGKISTTKMAHIYCTYLKNR